MNGVPGQAKITSSSAQCNQLTSLVENCVYEQKKEETREAMIIVTVERKQ